MKKIAVVTATRAEYGLLSPVIKKLRAFENESFKADLIVTGTHLSEQYGMTISEIDGRIDHKIPISVKSSSGADISANQAEALVKFTDLFLAERYDGIVLLGDRYEMLAIAIAAGNTHTPIFHLCGGDTTEGALDEWIRHSITKISYLHFVTNEESRKRVIQLGEHCSRVFNYGSTSIDNILNVADMTKAEALQSIGLDDCKYALCTYHPVTMEDGSVDEQIESFLGAVKYFPWLQFIVTKSNADQGGARINELLDEAEKEINNLHVFTSLGVRRYLSLMKYAEFVLGNSSSGIIETPAFHVPTVNIGDRQRGRLQSESIINCGEDTGSIVTAIKKAVTAYFKEVCNKVVSPYGDGHAAEEIAKKIYGVVSVDKIDLKKKFYDIPEIQKTVQC
ncbi:MAG: UDP-N-acetylglucosamine 2-epimerase (hydrolyzing) [Anaerovibrio sp.]|uniref:UDP-N-acetylglucosamine 2-epimerase n=1 Tax=Anaerovibrio sp. TaxID=1872532 RepID=UPI001B22987D|nr:UDP-N-acetylglucosamine 2-epimerase [Anaerovibrio sp.]MBO6246251.1 UDP-N-acetylglucosamine 2-epimerase (hydrolyzing) [Anaerovibrio sp.]